MQAELYRAAETGKAGAWRHLGEHEQPYYTAMPVSGSKKNVKWVDLVLAEPKLESPEEIVWIELKDIGRNSSTLKNNIKGLGQDLAALYRLDPKKTMDIWADPPFYVIDKGRKNEWDLYAKSLDTQNHLIAQIVLVPKIIFEDTSADSITKSWLETFENRASVKPDEHKISISHAIGEKFMIFSLISKLGQANGENKKKEKVVVIPNWGGLPHGTPIEILKEFGLKTEENKDKNK